MRYSIYNKATGVITSRMDVATIDDALLNVGENEGIIAGDYDETVYYVKDGGVFEYPTMSPGYWAVWSGSAWIDPRSQDRVHFETERHRVQMIETINKECGDLRKKFVTSIPAQDMIYQAKEAEAKAFLSDSDADPMEYPMLSAEVGITGDSLFQVAQIIMHLSFMLRQVAAGLERVRLNGIKGIEEATTIDNIDASYRIYSVKLSFYKQEIGQ